MSYRAHTQQRKEAVGNAEHLAPGSRRDEGPMRSQRQHGMAHAFRKVPLQRVAAQEPRRVVWPRPELLQRSPTPRDVVTANNITFNNALQHVVII